MSSSPTSCSWPGILEAATLVLITTLDSCVWLASFVAAAPTRRIAVIHGAAFLVTQQTLALVWSMGTLLVITWRQGVNSEDSSDVDNDDSVLELVAAILCWLLAGALIFKKIQKQKRKREQQNEYVEMVAYETIPSAETTGNEEDTLAPTRTNLSDDPETDQSDKTENPLMVATLTLLGFMDESAYFPSLILGGYFSAFELWLGTVLAGVVTLGIVTIFLSPFKPLIDWLNKHVKVYGVVTIFAIILTVQVILDRL